MALDLDKARKAAAVAFAADKAPVTGEVAEVQKAPPVEALAYVRDADDDGPACLVLVLPLRVPMGSLRETSNGKPFVVYTPKADESVRKRKAPVDVVDADGTVIPLAAQVPGAVNVYFATSK